MLTKNNVIQLYNDGLVIRWRRKKHPHHLKGEYDPVGFEVNIYTAHLLSEHDRDMTLLHELIHARDDHKGLPNNRTCSPRVEREAEATYQRRPGVVPRLVLEKSPLQKQITVLEISPELAPFSLGICTVKKNLRNPKILAFWEIAAP